MRLVSHRATIGGTEDEWLAVAARIDNRRLKRAIEGGVRRHNRPRDAYHPDRGWYHEERHGREIMLRFNGGSIKRIADAVAAIEGERGD